MTCQKPCQSHQLIENICLERKNIDLGRRSMQLRIEINDFNDESEFLYKEILCNEINKLFSDRERLRTKIEMLDTESTVQKYEYGATA